MPDIMTFNRMAAILGVDLNYFSEEISRGWEWIWGPSGRHRRSLWLRALKNGPPKERGKSPLGYVTRELGGR